MLVPARFNVLLDRFGRPVEPVKTVKMGWRKGFRKLRGQYPDGTWPFGVRWASRARYNRFLQRIRRLIKKLGIWRSILSELCGDLLGSYFAERVRDCTRRLLLSERSLAHSLTRSLAHSLPSSITDVQFLPANQCRRGLAADCRSAGRPPSTSRARRGVRDRR